MICKNCNCTLFRKDFDVRLKQNSLLLVVECPNCKYKEGCWIHKHHLHKDTKGLKGEQDGT